MKKVDYFVVLVSFGHPGPWDRTQLKLGFLGMLVGGHWDLNWWTVMGEILGLPLCAVCRRSCKHCVSGIEIYKNRVTACLPNGLVMMQKCLNDSLLCEHKCLHLCKVCVSVFNQWYFKVVNLLRWLDVWIWHMSRLWLNVIDVCIAHKYIRGTVVNCRKSWSSACWESWCVSAGQVAYGSLILGPKSISFGWCLVYGLLSINLQCYIDWLNRVNGVLLADWLLGRKPLIVNIVGLMHSFCRIGCMDGNDMEVSRC